MVGACHGVELVGVQFARRFFGEAACFFRGALAADVLDAECVLSQAGVDGAQQYAVRLSAAHSTQACFALVGVDVGRGDDVQQFVLVGQLHAADGFQQVVPVLFAGGDFQQRVGHVVLPGHVLPQGFGASFGQPAVVLQASFGRGIAADVDAPDHVVGVLPDEVQGRVNLGQFGGIAVAVGVEARLVDGVDEEGVALSAARGEGARTFGLGRRLEQWLVEGLLFQCLFGLQHVAAVASRHLFAQAEAGVVHPRLVGDGGPVADVPVLLLVAPQGHVGLFIVVLWFFLQLDGAVASVGHHRGQFGLPRAVCRHQYGRDPALVVGVDDAFAQVEHERHFYLPFAEADAAVRGGGDVFRRAAFGLCRLQEGCCQHLRDYQEEIVFLYHGSDGFRSCISG